ncbi:AAA-like domain-containing protein [Leptothoe sp. PORK10 BA2]|uniref:AAA-like domain-containing protein n=1 Tax=Leptothoe sp. PORK10 BA2 TaxID=3110254 RepID=UPI002B1EB82B|nr:AAA-like domain-containing protein [Leptothoe sp. PORK10 BA2]MEA5464866.1 AAA-like domain-containing protein [Leptothoe sp. PORK10 BA2]
MKKILILTANPKNSDKLRLDEEVREIQEGLQRSRSRDQFEIISKWAVRPDDLRRALLDHEPNIVHFSGHGAGEAGLVLENNAGQMQLVSAPSLARLFKLFKDKVECVLLNACYSEVQAAAIHQHIDCVIGMNQAIGDRAAIEFAVGFYDGLGAGRSYGDAFEFGVSAIDLEGIPETATPQLKQRSPSASQSGEITSPVQTPAEAASLPSASSSQATSSQAASTQATSTQATAELGLQSEPVTPRPTAGSRIFISYKRGVEPDEPIASEVYRALSGAHDVFIDQTMSVGTPWAERIEQALQASDFLIIFLSAESVHSEMVLGEIETAHRLMKTSGRPMILPVRLGYREPFVYPLSAYLNPINWALWETPADTPQLLEELQRAIAGAGLSIDSENAKRNVTVVSNDSTTTPAIPRPQPSAQPVLLQPVVLEPAEGTMDPESQLYVKRACDEIAQSTIQRQGVTLTIKGPRQMGKSSLLMQVMDAAIKVGKQVVFLDFQLFDQDVLKSANTFYPQFCRSMTEQLGLPDRVAESWEGSSGNIQRCTRYMQTHVLKELGSPLVLAMDEVDRMFDADYRSDFFSMLRSWHNNRALPMARIWKQFDLALVTATEPYHLIANLNQSPFNVGEVLLLTDFTSAQVTDLNQRHGNPLTPAEERALMALLNGHPYLVRRALYLIARQQLSVAALFEQADGDHGPFGDHLRYHLFRIYDKQDLAQGLLQVIRARTCPDERIARLLSAAGLVRREDEQVVPRCQLYADYFRRHLHG